jgi:hypothetical protein
MHFATNHEQQTTNKQKKRGVARFEPRLFYGETAERTAGLRGVLILDAFGLLFRILLGW